MKNSISTMFLLVTLLLVGCEYESPLSKDNEIPIDKKVLGLWENATDKDKKSNIMILKYSDNEYLVRYPDGMYYRGYPIKVDDLSCVQLQVIGEDNQPLGSSNKDIFQVVSYKFHGDNLEIKILNTDLIGDDLKTTESLRRSFKKNKDNKNLFNKPGIFKKIKS